MTAVPVRLEELPPPFSVAHIVHIRELALAVVAAESSEADRERWLDALFAMHRPSLHGDWRAVCGLCEPPGDDQPIELTGPVMVTWETDSSASPCIRCLARTKTRVDLVDVGERWPMCERHSDAEALEAVERRHAMQQRLRARLSAAT